MGTITRSFANNITTSGVLLPASLTNNSIANVTAYNASVATGGMVLLSSQTASNSASISFTTGINSTYKEYQFWFINLQPVSSGNYKLQFNLSTDSGSNYNVTKTTTFFNAFHDEPDTSSGLAYNTGDHLAQSTSFQNISSGIGNTDEAVCGFMSLFNPSSTTYVKHFIAQTSSYRGAGLAYNYHSLSAGYGNTTSAINAVRFIVDTGNIDDGTILMYGIV
jgi:hypothetical protein